MTIQAIGEMYFIAYVGIINPYIFWEVSFVTNLLNMYELYYYWTYDLPADDMVIIIDKVIEYVKNVPID